MNSLPKAILLIFIALVSSCKQKVSHQSADAEFLTSQATTIKIGQDLIGEDSRQLAKQEALLDTCTLQELTSWLNNNRLIEIARSNLFSQYNDSLLPRGTCGKYSAHDTLLTHAFRYSGEDFFLYRLPTSSHHLGASLLVNSNFEGVSSAHLLNDNFDESDKLAFGRGTSISFQTVNDLGLLFIEYPTHGTGYRINHLEIFKISEARFVQIFQTNTYVESGTEDTTTLWASWPYFRDVNHDGFLDIQIDAAEQTMDTQNHAAEYSRLWVQWTLKRVRPDSSFFFPSSVYLWDSVAQGF